MPLNLRPHEQEKRPKDGRAARMKVKPYIRLTNGVDVPPVFAQDGMYFTEGGPEIEELPDWVEGAMAKLSDEARASVGFDKKPEVKKPEAKKPEATKSEDKDVELKVEFKVDPKAEVKEPKVEVKEPSADATKQRKGT